MKDGLYNRYIVEKASGKPIDPSAEYFVLRLDEGGRDRTHVEACKKAVLVYANEIAEHLPELASDLQRKYGIPLTAPSKVAVPPRNFVDTLKCNVDNERLTDTEFRAFVRNSLPVVETKEQKEQRLRKKYMELLSAHPYVGNLRDNYSRFNFENQTYTISVNDEMQVFVMKWTDSGARTSPIAGMVGRELETWLKEQMKYE